MTECTQAHGNTQAFQMPGATLRYYDYRPGDIQQHQSLGNILLISVFSGTVEYTFGFTELSQTNMKLLLVPPYTRFHIHAFTQARLMMMEIGSLLLRTVAKNLHTIALPAPSINPRKPFVEITLERTTFTGIQNINSEYVKHNEDPYLVELALCRFLYRLMQTDYAPYLFPVQSSHPMDQVKYYIDQHITESIKISSLAAMAGMNGSNFTNTFKRHFNATPQEFIQRRKMAYAEELLKSHLVTDVALEVGYENVSTFISHFRKVYHRTPKQYQLYELSS